MRGYFSQFGAVTRLRLARSKKVGVAVASKHNYDNYAGLVITVKIIDSDRLHII